MQREDVLTVKIYFINPIDLISVVINTLTELEYETYEVVDQDKEKLLEILPQNNRNIIFLSVTKQQELPKWFEYIEKLLQVTGTLIQIGAFVYNKIDMENKGKFLLNNISVTPFTDLTENTLETFKKILLFFEAKGTRHHVRVKAYGISEVFISLPGLEKPVTGKVVELSTYAFSGDIASDVCDYLKIGAYYENVLLNLRGIRLRVTVKIIGFSKANKNILIFKFTQIESKDNKLTYSDSLPRETRKKLFTYIKACLKESLKEQLHPEDKPANPPPPSEKAAESVITDT